MLKRSWFRNHHKVFFWMLWFILLAFTLAGCSFGPQRPAPDSHTLTQFIPPTLAPTSTPTLAPVPTLGPIMGGEEAAGTPDASNCFNNLSYVQDLTIPDDLIVVPGSSLDKRWEVTNSGTCNWGDGYELRLVYGEEMGALPVQDLPPSRSGTNVTIRINFTAPLQAGTYRSDWQAYSPDGVPFGDSFYIQIMVRN